MTDDRLDCYCYIAILEVILLCSNSLLLLFNCVQKNGLGSFKNVIYKMCFQIIYLIYMYKEDLALINLQGFICLKSQLHQTKLEPHHLWGCLTPLQRG